MADTGEDDSLPGSQKIESTPVALAKTAGEIRANVFFVGIGTYENEPLHPEIVLAQASSSAAASDGRSAQQKADYLIVIGDGVNVRFGPSTDSRIQMQLYRGHPVTKLEREGAWVRVAIAGTGGREGWIHGSLVAPAGGQPLASPSSTASEKPEQATGAEDPATQALLTPEPRPEVAAVPQSRGIAEAEVLQADQASVSPEPEPEVPAERAAAPSQPSADQSAGVAQVEQEPTTSPAQPVGEPPPEEEDERSAALEGLEGAEVGGVLTRKGTLVVEPSFQFTHSKVDRFTFRGIELVESVQIGVIDVEDANRNFLESAYTARYGLTRWLELEVRVPWIYRSDELSTRTTSGEQAITTETSIDTLNIGDIEAAIHAQLNRPEGSFPTFVANVRGKFPTGTHPFEIERDAFGVEQELPTGSGVYGVEPSVTALYTTDPLVLFGNVGYLFNLARDFDEVVATSPQRQVVGKVDPGDSLRIGFGMSFSVNEWTSFSLSYSHDFIDGTETEINGVSSQSEDLQVGTLTAGVFHRLNEQVAVNLSTGIGSTEDASDVSITLRVPISFNLF